MSNDPFTLDMFGNTALSSSLGIGLGTGALNGHDPFAANDDDPDPTPPAPAPALPVAAARKHGVRTNFYLDDDGRGLAAGWKERAKANVAAILLAGEIERQQRPATSEEQTRLIRFTGFGASELANGMFRRPGDLEFREGWDDLGSSLETVVNEGLARPLHAICPLHAGVRG